MEFLSHPLVLIISAVLFSIAVFVMVPWDIHIEGPEENIIN